MPTHSLGSASNHFHTASSSSLPSPLIQLSCFGRFKVTTNISGVGYDKMQYLVEGGDVLKVGTFGTGAMVGL
jgi:hypothetical protein